MWKAINEYENTGIPKFIGKKMFGIRKDDHSRLVQYSQNHDVIWRSPEYPVNSFKAIGDTLVYSVYRNKMVARDVNALSRIVYEYENPFPLNDGNVVENLFIGNVKGVGFIKFDLDVGKVIEILNKERIPSLLSLTANKLILYDKFNCSVEAYNHDFQSIWNHHFRDICAYELNQNIYKAEINNIYLGEGVVYLLAGLSIVCIRLETGDIIWHTKLNTAQNRGIVGADFIYTTSNAYLNKVKLSTGEVFYQEKRLEGLGPIGELIWHDDFLWAIMDASPSLLLCIDPETGNYIETTPLPELGITSDCNDPVFHEGKMYILDHGNMLHVFEKE